MKQCAFCGKDNADDSSFCISCGKELGATASQAQAVNPVPVQPNVNSNVPPKKNSGFISDDEYVVASLLNSKALNILSGEGVKSEDAVLTNKRLYYTSKKGILNINAQEEKVNVKDITGTKIANNNPLGLLVISALALIIGLIMAITNNEIEMFFFIFLPVTLVLLFVYLFLKKSKLRIEYAGGSISFSVKKYKKENIQFFQKSIYLVKDGIDANSR
ncbi:MAG: zinc ribbon domain-containing protein [Clostridia bacterium]|nr:zinc ribbon domain-containing protein [Clostridia bacterium]